MTIKTYLLSLLFLLTTHLCSGQVLISLIFGDKLNSGKVEFGLDGGFNWSNIRGLEQSKWTRDFNLGFYFDIKLKNPSWMVHTGVLVKSSVGPRGFLPTR